MRRHLSLAAAVAASGVAAQGRNDTAAVIAHVASSAPSTFRPPSGLLPFKYLVPAGPYDSLWDWDSMFLGVATLQWGSGPYLTGSMMNFLSNTSVPGGEVKGCLTPTGATDVL
jgi:hypothetical protein